MAEHLNIPQTGRRPDSPDRNLREALARTLRYRAGDPCDRVLKAGWIDTPLGAMLAAGDDDHLYILNYVEQSSLERKVAVIQKKLRARLEPGDAPTVAGVTREMKEYFAGTRRAFETPLALPGTSFQALVWEELRRIPYGVTIAYAELAKRIGKPAAFRAVAQANSQNPLAIVIPCHRVINNDGGLGGYSAGTERKRWLLDFERGKGGRHGGRGRHSG